MHSAYVYSLLVFSYISSWADAQSLSFSSWRPRRFLFENLPCVFPAGELANVLLWLSPSFPKAPPLRCICPSASDRGDECSRPRTKHCAVNGLLHAAPIWPKEPRVGDFPTTGSYATLHVSSRK